MVPDENTGAGASAAETAKSPVQDPKIVKLEKEVDELKDALKKQKESNKGLRTQIKNLKAQPKGKRPPLAEHK